MSQHLLMRRRALMAQLVSRKRNIFNGNDSGGGYYVTDDCYECGECEFVCSDEAIMAGPPPATKNLVPWSTLDSKTGLTNAMFSDGAAGVDLVYDNVMGYVLRHRYSVSQNGAATSEFRLKPNTNYVFSCYIRFNIVPTTDRALFFIVGSQNATPMCAPWRLDDYVVAKSKVALTTDWQRVWAVINFGSAITNTTSMYVRIGSYPASAQQSTLQLFVSKMQIEQGSAVTAWDPYITPAYYYIDRTKCTECSVCETTCPVQAIVPMPRWKL